MPAADGWAVEYQQALECSAALYWPKLHRPTLGHKRGVLTSDCRYCGKSIRRAHPKSTWWRVYDTEPESFASIDDPGEGAE